MKLACVQTLCLPNRWADNLESACAQADQLLKTCRPDLLQFPEAFPAYIGAQGKIVSGEPLDGPTVLRMQQLAKQGNCLVLFGMLRQGTDGRYNSAILTDSSRVLGVYDKTHLYWCPRDPGHHEQENFRAGNKLGVFETDFGRLGVMICHDGVYPEVPRTLALEGADLICWLMNNGDMRTWAAHYARSSILPVSIANPVAPAGSAHASNGFSIIADGNGAVLAEAASKDAEVLVAELDLTKWRNLRKNGEGMHAVYRVRRPELYATLVK